ncbi:MAG: hypothetical protein K2L93_02870 [Muribaculaceae bacterium]|nr:hypothetical protein [Muribaculaceae bacterium]
MYDETQAVKHINHALQDAYGITYPTDELLNVIDIIWDFYDDNDLLDLDIDNEAELDVEALRDKVRKMLAKDRNSPIKPEHIDAIIDAELQYEDEADAEEME